MENKEINQPLKPNKRTEISGITKSNSGKNPGKLKKD